MDVSCGVGACGAERDEGRARISPLPVRHPPLVDSFQRPGLVGHSQRAKRSLRLAAPRPVPLCHMQPMVTTGNHPKSFGQEAGMPFATWRPQAVFPKRRVTDMKKLTWIRGPWFPGVRGPGLRG